MLLLSLPRTAFNVRPMGDEDLTDNFHIVFMCTGNQARSVIAEHYTRKITAGLPVTVESVGLLDTRGAPALPEAVHAAGALSLDLAGHVSRPFTAIDLSVVDLVIGFEQQHVATAVVDGNADPAGAFKLLELVRLLDETGEFDHAESSEGARTMIAAAAAARGGATGFAPGEDLADPAGRKSAFFDRTASAIQEACDALITRLFPVGGQSSNTEHDPQTTSGARIWD